jgi:hypothetical protein
LVVWLFGWLFDWLVVCLFACLFVCLFGWLFLVGLLFPSLDLSSHPQERGNDDSKEAGTQTNTRDAINLGSARARPRVDVDTAQMDDRLKAEEERMLRATLGKK